MPIAKPFNIKKTARTIVPLADRTCERVLADQRGLFTVRGPNPNIPAGYNTYYTKPYDVMELSLDVSRQFFSDGTFGGGSDSELFKGIQTEEGFRRLYNSPEETWASEKFKNLPPAQLKDFQKAIVEHLQSKNKSLEAWKKHYTDEPLIGSAPGKEMPYPGAGAHARALMDKTIDLVQSATTITGVIAALTRQADILHRQGLHKHPGKAYGTNNSDLYDAIRDVHGVASKHLQESLKVKPLVSHVNMVLGNTTEVDSARKDMIAQLDKYIAKRIKWPNDTIMKGNESGSFELSWNPFTDDIVTAKRVDLAIQLRYHLATSTDFNGEPINGHNDLAKMLKQAMDDNMDIRPGGGLSDTLRDMGDLLHFHARPHKNDHASQYKASGAVSAFIEPPRDFKKYVDDKLNPPKSIAQRLKECFEPPPRIDADDDNEHDRGHKI